MSVHPIVLFFWLGLLFVGVIPATCLIYLGFRRASVVVLLAGCLLTAVFTVLGAPALAQTSDEQLQALVDSAQAKAQASMDSLRVMTDAAARRSKPYEAEAAATQAPALERANAAMGSLDDPDLKAAAGSMFKPQDAGSALYVAVSLSMPPETLRALANDANKAGAKVVIRGLVNGSFKQTVVAIRQVFDEHSASGVGIDPQVFRAYGVTAAPTFIATTGAIEPCGSLDCVATAKPFDKVSGNISMAAALKRLADSGETGARRAAAAALARLEG